MKAPGGVTLEKDRLTGTEKAKPAAAHDLEKSGLVQP